MHVLDPEGWTFDYLLMKFCSGKIVKPTIMHNKLIITIKEFRCYEAKIEESEKAGSCWESNPGHLWLN